MATDLSQILLTGLGNCLMMLENNNGLDLIVIRLDSIILSLRHAEFHRDSASMAQQLMCLLESALQVLNNGERTYAAQEQRSVGRPTINLSLDSIEYLLSLNFHVPKIASMLGVSRETIFRRLRAHGLSVTQSYTQISDEDLSQLILDILQNHPNTGYKRMKGFLLARSVKVTDDRVRMQMRLVDPNGVYQRALENRVIVRRQYYVPYSNSLWHIDTNMKLIRWKIVIRGAIDGKSRLATFLDASGDNLSSSNLSSFLTAVEAYGVPFRTRSDKGKENVLIARYMLEKRGLNRGSHICGRSVNNQRIERFWRDVFRCSGFYYSVFHRLEHDGILDIDNPKHIALVHFVFLPRINRHLLEFRNAWNYHPISSERSFTPMQLQLMHLPPPELDLQVSSDDLFGAYFLCNGIGDLDQFEESGDDTIVNPVINYNALTNEELHRLRRIDILRESETFGCDIFQEALAQITE